MAGASGSLSGRIVSEEFTFVSTEFGLCEGDPQEGEILWLDEDLKPCYDPSFKWFPNLSPGFVGTLLAASDVTFTGGTPIGSGIFGAVHTLGDGSYNLLGGSDLTLKGSSSFNAGGGSVVTLGDDDNSGDYNLFGGSQGNYVGSYGIWGGNTGQGTGSYGLLWGSLCELGTLSGPGSFNGYGEVGGDRSKNYGLYGRAVGSLAVVTADRQYSFADGRLIKADADDAHVIGSGVPSGTYLVNDIEHSLLVGFNSNRGALFVGGGSGAGTSGNVGINTDDDFGSGIGVLGMRDATTVPSADPVNGVVLYSEAGQFKTRGSDGVTSTMLTAAAAAVLESAQHALLGGI